MSTIFETDEYRIKGNENLPYDPSPVVEGHTYDLEPSSDKSKVTLTEDGEDKTTLPLVATFVGTRAEWNALSAADKAKYRIVHFTDDGGSDDISEEHITFTSSDTTDANATSWTGVTTLSSGLSLKTLFSRVSQMFKNVRYLYNTIKKISKFSTSEIVIGKWIDGRTLYRRVVQFTMNGTATITLVGGTTGTNTAVSASWLSNVKEIVRQYGTAWTTSSKTYGRVPVPCTYNNNRQINIWIDVDAQTINLRNIGYQNCQGELVLEYTKK